MPGKAGRVRGQAMGANAPMVRSVERAARIMYALYSARQGKRIADLAEELQLPKRTVRRLLHTLVANHSAERDEESDRYYAQAAPWMMLASSLPRLDSSDDTIHAALRDLERETGLRVSLASPAPRRHAMVKVAWYAPLAAAGAKATDRAAMPVHATAAGLLYLGTLTPDNLRAWASGELARFTKHTVASPRSLIHEVAQVRKQGYAVCHRMLVPDSSAVAVPVRDSRGRMFATISVGGPAELLTEDRIQRCLPFMRRASERLSRLVPGGSGGETDGEGKLAQGRGRGRTHGMVARGGKSRARSAEGGGGSAPLVRSVERATRIMEVLWSVPEGKRLADIGEELGLHKTTALRLLRTLIAVGAVYRDEATELYRCSPALWLSAPYRLQHVVPVTRAFRGILENLADAAGMVALLATPDERREATIVGASAMPRKWMSSDSRERQLMGAAVGERVGPGRVSPPRPREFVEKEIGLCPGARFIAQERRIEPMHATAAGKIYLAGLSRMELEEWMRKASAKVAEDATTFRERLIEELARVREQGYAVGSREIFPNTFSLAVPVRGATGKTVASLVIVGPAALVRRPQIARWVGILRSNSQRVSELLSASRESAGESTRWGA